MNQDLTIEIMRYTFLTVSAYSICRWVIYPRIKQKDKEEERQSYERQCEQVTEQRRIALTEMPRNDRTPQEIEEIINRTLPLPKKP